MPRRDMTCVAVLAQSNGVNLINALVTSAPVPYFLGRAAGYTLTTNEPCTNQSIYPGETVTVNLILQNAGGSSSTNLVAT